jgi:hypothetical protein
VLRPRPRKDRGRGQKLPPALRELLLDIRREQPAASGPTILLQLQIAGGSMKLWPVFISTALPRVSASRTPGEHRPPAGAGCPRHDVRRVRMGGPLDTEDLTGPMIYEPLGLETCDVGENYPLDIRWLGRVRYEKNWGCCGSDYLVALTALL